MVYAAHPTAPEAPRQEPIATRNVIGYLYQSMNTLMIPLWLSDPAWMAMDPASRGLHTQLMLVAARRRPLGTLPDDDLKLRKWLGIPVNPTPKTRKPKPSTDGELGSILHGLLESGGGPEKETDPAALTIWLWENLWKPSILSSWQKVDTSLVEQYPHTAKELGGWFHPIAYAMADGASAPMAPSVEVATKKIKKTNKKPAKSTPIIWGEQLDLTGHAANQGLEVGEFGLENLMDTKKVLARWRPEMADESRKSMWEVGVDCLVGTAASYNEKAKARSILGKHIKQYGEEAVAKAVGVMAMRSVPPADSISFLQGLLKQETEGSTAERSAREKRASLCL